MVESDLPTPPNGSARILVQRTPLGKGGHASPPAGCPDKGRQPSGDEEVKIFKSEKTITKLILIPKRRGIITLKNSIPLRRFDKILNNCVEGHPKIM